MCGRLPVGKSFFEVMHGWSVLPVSGLSMRRLRMAAGHNAFREIRSRSKAVVNSCHGTSGVSRSPDRPAGCIILVLPFPTSLARVKRASLKLPAEQALCSVCR